MGTSKSWERAIHEPNSVFEWVDKDSDAQCNFQLPKIKQETIRALLVYVYVLKVMLTLIFCDYFKPWHVQEIWVQVRLTASDNNQRLSLEQSVVHVAKELVSSHCKFHTTSFGPVIYAIHWAPWPSASSFYIFHKHHKTAFLGDTSHQGKHLIKNLSTVDWQLYSTGTAS